MAFCNTNVTLTKIFARIYNVANQIFNDDVFTVRMPELKIYRRNVAIIVLNDVGQILAGERSDIPGAWQLPQGGIEDGETPLEAMRRELVEEIGTASVSILAELPHTISYDWPETKFDGRYHGQEQNYFLVRLEAHAVIDLNGPESTDEFSSILWLGATEFVSRVSGFKAEAYKEAIAYFQKHYPEIITS